LTKPAQYSNKKHNTAILYLIFPTVRIFQITRKLVHNDVFVNTRSWRNRTKFKKIICDNYRGILFDKKNLSNVQTYKFNENGRISTAGRPLVFIKLSWQLFLIVHIITKYKITHYQYLILHNREFRSFGNLKNYFKSTTVTLHGNVVRVHLCFVYIVLPLIIIIIKIYFFVWKMFSIFFSCTFKHPRYGSK
jgi:hypothetical protein